MEDVPTAIQKAVAAMTTTEGQAEALTAADLRAEAMAIQTTEVATDTHPKAAAMAILKEGTAATPMATDHQEGATMQTTEEVTAILQKDVHITTAVLQRGEATETAKAEASVLQEEGLHSEHLKDLQEEDGKPAGRNNSRPQAKPNPYRFNETDEKNMSMILSRKPQLDQIQLSDNDYVETPIKETIRLNKFIANSGICSRREADQYIQAGVVTVNGEVVTELGSKVNVLNDDIRFNGERIRGEEKVYIVMNKPKGFVTTASDPHAEKTVMDLLKNCSARVFPVGRLDKNTTGVLMFTNDGEIAERLTHPSYDKKKIYQVILDKPLAQEDYDKILEGISLSDGDIKADELEYIDAEDHRKLGIEIHSGKNRIVRRIFESLGYEVKALDRVYFAGLTKKGLKKGEWRYLSEGEANVLKMGAYV